MEFRYPAIVEENYGIIKFSDKGLVSFRLVQITEGTVTDTSYKYCDG